MTKKSLNPIIIFAFFIIAGCSTTSPEVQTEIPALPESSLDSADTNSPLDSPTMTAEIIELYQIPDDYNVNINVNGIQRSFLLHVPPGYQPGEPTPLVFNLHGAGGSAHGQANRSHMDAKSDQAGFLLVYPQALHEPSAWLGPLSGPASANDNHLFEEMIAYLEGEMSIDPARIYITGISNGGTMTNHLGCIMSDTIAAIAPVAAGNANFAGCLLEKPISVLVFHGTDDGTIPIDGDEQRNLPAVHDWVEGWADLNGCELSPSTDQSNDDFQKETWGDCIGGAEVTYYAVENGLHEWPGSAYGPGPYDTGLEPDIYATDLIWEFFEAHPKSNEVIAEPSIDPTLLARYQNPGDYIDMLPVDGYTRWFSVHIPSSYDPDAPTPLMINLHGYTGTMFDQQEVTSMNTKADQEGFIAVHPQALGDPPSWHGPLPGVPGQADKDFFVFLLEYLQAIINIDPARIYATGFSNGATMSTALGCFMSETFAGIAPVAGGHTDFANCEIERPVSVLVVHGTEDPTIPYEGRGNEVPPVSLWVEYWVQRNGCQPNPQVEEPDPTIMIETWQGCDEGVTVRLITRVGGGHVWPGSSMAYFRENVESQINATDVIWEFFATNPRSQE